MTFQKYLAYGAVFVVIQMHDKADQFTNGWLAGTVGVSIPMGRAIFRYRLEHHALERRTGTNHVA